jgi:hypothetical protein
MLAPRSSARISSRWAVSTSDADRKRRDLVFAMLSQHKGKSCDPTVPEFKAKTSAVKLPPKTYAPFSPYTGLFAEYEIVCIHRICHCDKNTGEPFQQ